MTDYGLLLFAMGFVALGCRKPFLWVLFYCYVDIVAPQQVSWHLLAAVPLSLVVFVLAFGGWLALDDKADSRFTYRQGLICLLLVYCGCSTLVADYPAEAATKWAWVWKALIFAVFLPLTLRTRLRIEAVALVMILSVATIVISGGLKTVLGGGGYAALSLLVNTNTGLYEGSTLAMVASSIIPLIWWLARHGTIFPRHWTVTLFALALTFACLLIPIGTEARTGLLCAAMIAVLALRTVKRRFLYVALGSLALLVAIPFVPKSYTARLGTIENHEADESASTRLAVWSWTLGYVKDHPMGGGFESYLGNTLRYKKVVAPGADAGDDTGSGYIEDKGRAFHSGYFEMLGEQGWPGLILWLTLQLTGLWQMERIRWKWKKRTGPDEQWQAPLATALQLSHCAYMVGALFVGIAYQPFILMLIAVQCGLWSYLKRIDAPAPRRLGQGARLKPLAASPAAAPPAAA
jgi:probable O-glycosylation ligase (exosortase A-associated)